MADQNILEELPQFSPRAEKVYNALLGTQAGDGHIKIFAKRIARAITAYEAGNLEKIGPLERFLLCGTTFSSIPLLVQTVAQNWIGEPWDGSSPFIYIDCTAFQVVYPGMLSPLIGSISSDQFGEERSPLLAQIELPHLKSRRGKELRALQEWSQTFVTQRAEKINGLGQIAPNFFQQFRFLVMGVWQKIYNDERTKNGPFGSIIFFDGIDRASQPLQELIFQIVRNGLLPLADGTIINLSNTILIASIYPDEQLFRESARVGFRPPNQDDLAESLPNINEDYYKIRKHLLCGSKNSSFVRAMAENLIIVGNRTHDSQMHLVKSELEKISERLGKYGIELHFTPEFIEGFVSDTKETAGDGATYTAERIKSGLKRHVFDALHRLILFRKLRGGSRLLLERGEGQKFNADIREIQGGQGELIIPETVRSFMDNTNGTAKAENENYAWLDELNEKAKSLLKALVRGD